MNVPVAIIIVLVSSWAFVGASTIFKAPKKPSIPALPFLSNRVQLNFTFSNRMEQTQACDVFHISYQDVERSYTQILQSITTSAAQEEQCIHGCIDDDIIGDCWGACERARLNEYNEELRRHALGPLVVSLLMLDLGDSVDLDCVPYFKDSTVGNCFAQEYLILNKKTDDSPATFDRESATTSDGKYFQCRANALAEDGDNPNQYDCRSVFRTSRARLRPIDTFMLPYYSNARSIHSQCILSISPFLDSVSTTFESTRCWINFVHNVQLGYIQCRASFDSNDCDIHSAITGIGTILCPAFRRGSMIDECSVVDYISLHQLDAVKVDDNGNEVFSIPNACVY